jgi:hypothetical protein
VSPRESLLAALVKIDDALCAGRFDIVDDLLAHTDWTTIDLDMAVTVLMTCKPARDQLSQRAPSLEQFRARVEAEQPDRAAAILRWL